MQSALFQRIRTKYGEEETFEGNGHRFPSLPLQEPEHHVPASYVPAILPINSDPFEKVYLADLVLEVPDDAHKADYLEVVVEHAHGDALLGAITHSGTDLVSDVKLDKSSKGKSDDDDDDDDKGKGKDDD